MKTSIGGKLQEIQFVPKFSSLRGNWGRYGHNGLSMDLRGNWNVIKNSSSSFVGTDRVYLTSAVTVPVDSISLRFDAKVNKLRTTSTTGNYCPFMK